MDQLIVPDAEIDDVTAHLGCDADEIGPHRGVVRLRPSLPLQQCDDHGHGGSGDDQGAEQPPRDTPCTRISEPVVRCHGLDPEQRHPEDEGDENREARVDERSRAEVGVHADPEEEPTRDDGDTDADRGAEHPRREKRSDDVDLRAQGSS